MNFSMQTYDNWSQGSCKYHCTICDSDHNDFIRFRHHIKYNHQVHMPTYVKDNPDYCTLRNTIECALCSRVIAHDRADMRLHFGKVHPSTSLRDYFATYVEDSGD